MAEKVIGFVKENLAVILDVLTALTALYIVFRDSITPLKPEQFNTWILAVLAIMAISGVAERLGVFNELRNTSKAILNLLGEWAKTRARAAFLKTYDDLASLRDRVGDARVIWISGRTLSSMIGIYRDLFLQKISGEDCHMRILIVDPDGDVPKAETLHHHGEGNLQHCASKAENTIASLKILKRDLGEKSHNLEVRLLDYSPRFGLMITDPEHDNGVAQVQLLSHWRTSWGRPIFRIKKGDNPRWFGEFVLQFSQLWDRASPLWDGHSDEAGKGPDGEC